MIPCKDWRNDFMMKRRSILCTGKHVHVSARLEDQYMLKLLCCELVVCIAPQKTVPGMSMLALKTKQRPCHKGIVVALSEKKAAWVACRHGCVSTNLDIALFWTPKDFLIQRLAAFPGES